MGVGEFSDEAIVSNLREDAFHGVVLACSLELNHPLKQTVKHHFEEILKAIDDYSAS